MAPPYKTVQIPAAGNGDQHSLQEDRGHAALSFTYIIGAVALERGVADDKRARITVDGTAVLKTEVQRWMSHRRTYSKI